MSHSIYVNGFNLYLNEVAMITFNENSQTGTQQAVKIALTYEVLKMMHKTLGDAIEQHDKKLHELRRSKENMN